MATGVVDRTLDGAETQGRPGGNMDRVTEILSLKVPQDFTLCFSVKPYSPTLWVKRPGLICNAYKYVLRSETH